MSPIPFTPPHTITTGELVTVSTMNLEWGGNVSFLANPPACRVYNNAAIVIANITDTKLTFNSERYDTDTMHSTSTFTGRITFTTAGLYYVTGHIVWIANATGSRLIGIWLNGTTVIANSILGNAGAADATAQSISTVYKFAAGDYVELNVFQRSGGNLNVSTTPNQSPEFAATWIGLG